MRRSWAARWGVVMAWAGLALACGDVDRQPRQPNEAPLAALRAPESARVGERLLLDASESSDPDGSLVEYRFEPGAGLETLIVSEPVLSYEYGETGSYVVTLTVVDNRGATATATGNVAVH